MHHTIVSESAAMLFQFGERVGEGARVGRLEGKRRDLAVAKMDRSSRMLLETAISWICFTVSKRQSRSSGTGVMHGSQISVSLGITIELNKLSEAEL